MGAHLPGDPELPGHGGAAGEDFAACAAAADGDRAEGRPAAAAREPRLHGIPPVLPRRAAPGVAPPHPVLRHQRRHPALLTVAHAGLPAHRHWRNAPAADHCGRGAHADAHLLCRLHAPRQPAVWLQRSAALSAAPHPVAPARGIPRRAQPEGVGGQPGPAAPQRAGRDHAGDRGAGAVYEPPDHVAGPRCHAPGEAAGPAQRAGGGGPAPGRQRGRAEPASGTRAAAASADGGAAGAAEAAVHRVEDAGRAGRGEQPAADQPAAVHGRKQPAACHAERVVAPQRQARAEADADGR
mmetsp:Transcript_27026/g.70092  ORF Transcript_27026/g.70092 Transcript_27026/m.70092 type:complete len:296 (-) Transcript_27026:529-1416(-)